MAYTNGAPNVVLGKSLNSGHIPRKCPSSIKAPKILTLLLGNRVHLRSCLRKKGARRISRESFRTVCTLI